MLKRQGGGRGLLARLFVRAYTPKPKQVEPVQVSTELEADWLSLLRLPARVSPEELFVPTRIALTAEELAEWGPNVPGLFRIPGHSKIVIQLKQYFLQQRQRYSELSPSEASILQPSVPIPIPIPIPHTIHDVASTFKTFLADLPGGILGSVSVFESLRKAVLPLPNDSQESSLDFACVGLHPRPPTVPLGREEAHFVARILRGIDRDRRAIIIAVFGLLALLKHEGDSTPEVPDIDSNQCVERRTWDAAYQHPENILPRQPSIHNQRLGADSICAFGQPEKSITSENFTTSSSPAMSTTPIGPRPPERMSPRSLSLIFAPLLLGSLIDSIPLSPTPHPPSSSSSSGLGIFSSSSSKDQKRGSDHYRNSNSYSNGHRRASLRDLKRTSLATLYPHRFGASSGHLRTGDRLEATVERTQIAARVMEVLLSGWEDIVPCMVLYSRTC